MSDLAFFPAANVFHHGGQPVPIELSIASIPEDGKDSEVICITVDHSNILTTAKDSRANRYINERLSLKSHLPESVPLEYLSFCVRGKFCHLTQGNRGLIVVKVSDQRKFFEKLGLFTINPEILPHFRDLNDRTLPDHLHDEVHEDYMTFPSAPWRNLIDLRDTCRILTSCRLNAKDKLPSSRVSEKKIYRKKDRVDTRVDSDPFFQDTQCANVGRITTCASQ
ncbi:uncharacterized protein TNCV_686241 [Trichonephila clavipes]|nr:uncharacterized protein TNCV_686241 [Trichonephila clavipes]